MPETSESSVYDELSDDSPSETIFLEGRRWRETSRWQSTLRRRRLLVGTSVLFGVIGVTAISLLAFSTPHVNPLGGDYRVVLTLRVQASLLATIAGISLLTALGGALMLYLETGFRNILTRPGIDFPRMVVGPTPNISADQPSDTAPTSLEKSTADAKRLRADTVDRLTAEIAALGVRGNLNLALGGVTALAGIAMLFAFFVLQGPSIKTFQGAENSPQQLTDGGAHTSTAARETKPAQSSFDHWDYLIELFLPRLTMVIVVELFAYFFLNLYKSCLADIKYFQNEMTNVESKTLALRTAIEQKNDQMLGASVAALASTERNYILKKDESIVDLERSKIERERFTEMTGKILDALKDLKK